MFKTFIFDNENVIVNNNWNNVSALSSRALGLPEMDGKAFKKWLSCGDKKLLNCFSRGELTSEAFWKQVCLHYSIKPSADKICSLQTAMSQLTTEVDPDCIEAIQFLKSHDHKLYILSNSNVDITRGNKERDDYFRLIEKCYFSFEIHTRKPEREAYWIVLSENNLNPRDCIFIDDKPENVHAAQLLGIRGLLHKIADQPSLIEIIQGL